MRKRIQQIEQWMAPAEQALRTTQVDLDSGDLRATVNHAGYAVFRAATAALLTKGLERRRHSGVISAFREHLVRPGMIEAEYSHIYGEMLVVREDADYAIEIPVDAEMAETALRQAERFVERMSKYLSEEGQRNA